MARSATSARTRSTNTRARAARRSARPAGSRRPTVRSRTTAKTTSGGRSSRAPAHNEGNRAPIDQLLDRFTTALTSGDGQTCSECFEYPAMMVMAGAKNQALTDPNQVADFFGHAFEQYNSKGIYSTVPIVESILWLSDDLAQVRTRFPHIDQDGNDMGDGETSLYLIRTKGDDALVCGAITLGVDSERKPS